MKNQQNNMINDELSELRKEIDKVDNGIIKLLNKRVGIVELVGQHKSKNGESLFIRAAREADMIKNLLTKTDPKIPSSVIIDIWRKIITCANYQEQELKIAVHNPMKISDYNYLIQQYYGEFVPMSSYDSAAAVFSALEKKQVQVGIFALPDMSGKEAEWQNWWINIAHNSSGICVFAKIPFFEYKNRESFSKINLVALAVKPPEKSQKDKTLLMLEVASDITPSQIQNCFRKLNNSSKILKATRLEKVAKVLFYLVEADDFWEENGLLITNLKKSEIKPYVKIIGHYAAPVII